MSLLCLCRQKAVQPSLEEETSALLAEYRLGGTDFLDYGQYVRQLLPSGVSLPGQLLSFPMIYIYNRNTSNNPEPQVPGNVTYNTPSGIWGNQAKLFVQDSSEKLAAHFSDVNQGSLGNCWLMAALSALAGYGKVGSRTVVEEAFVGISPSGSANPSSVTVRIYTPEENMFGRTTSRNSIQQTITTRIPVSRGNTKSLVYVKSDAPGEYWPCMLEKAVAAVVMKKQGHVRGYDAMDGGFTAVGMGMFTPGAIAAFGCTGHNRPSADQLYRAWDACMRTGITICPGWIPKPKGGNAPGGEPYGYFGLVSSHAYTVFSIVNVGGVRLALLRNPWGKGSCNFGRDSNDGEWTGAWSDCSPQWQSRPDVAKACGFTGGRSDGLFWMSFDDIARYIDSYDVFIPERSDLRRVDLRPSPFLAGGSPSPSPSPDPQPGTGGFKDGIYIFTSIHGTKLRCNNDGSVDLAPHAQAWEQWRPVHVSGNTYYWRSAAHGTYLRAYPDGTVDAAPHAQEWEQWTYLGKRTVNGRTGNVWRSFHGSYLSGWDDGSVRCMPHIKEWELWN